MTHLGWLVGFVACAACAHTVPQDERTGPDGKVRGATPLELKDGEARAHGIVTYPGGDRVDWKLLELPDKQSGTLDLQLTWQAPRPGLQVAFDVFDEYGTSVFATKAAANKHGHTRSTSIEWAHGKYFIRVYAPRRGDAGTYKLVAAFKPIAPPTEPGIAIPDPPRLPALPDPEPEPAATTPPPTPPIGPTPTPTPPPPVPPKASPVVVRAIQVEVRGDTSQVTLAIGSERAPIDTTWTAEVLRTDSGKPLVGGKLILVRVGKTQTIAKSTLTIDQLTANPQVRLSPP